MLFLCITWDDGFDAGGDRSCSCVTMCMRSTSIRYQVSVVRSCDWNDLSAYKVMVGANPDQCLHDGV